MDLGGRSHKPEPRSLLRKLAATDPGEASDRLIWQQDEIARLTTQLQGAVDALRQLADLHHRTLTGSKKHDPENRDWTECECKSCRLAQPFARGQ